MSKATLAKAEPLKKDFDAAWRAKVKQYQVSLYSPETKGAWWTIVNKVDRRREKNQKSSSN